MFLPCFWGGYTYDKTKYKYKCLSFQVDKVYIEFAIFKLYLCSWLIEFKEIVYSKT